MNEPGNRGEGSRRARRWRPCLLAAAALALTGCPHNDYIVQLKPQGDGLDRTLVFYCAGGVNTNTGVPNYKSFDAAELAAITATYPPGGVTHEGRRYTAHGVFTNQLPSDVGGAGAYVHLATSLGEADFYSERFRGDDDFAGMIGRQTQAADQLADLMSGWAHAELRREPGYDRLRRFLDVDFRRDLKNAGMYFWAGQLAGNYRTNADEEFMVRFSQYLWERGYFKTGELPGLYQALTDNESQALRARIQRLVADKMGVPATNPVPASLAFLGNEKTLESSFDRYASGTKLYRDKLEQWKKEKKLHPDAKRPEPSDVAGDALGSLVAFELFGNPDHLAVRLSLAVPPLHTNGRWDEALRQVVWETDLEGRTNMTHVPYSCYAGWAQPDAAFQSAHLGETVLTGDPLTQYCLWRKSLDARQGAEWDDFLAALQPGAGLKDRVAAFRFSDEPVTATNGAPPAARRSAPARDLLRAALP